VLDVGTVEEGLLLGFGFGFGLGRAEVLARVGVGVGMAAELDDGVVASSDRASV